MKHSALKFLILIVLFVITFISYRWVQINTDWLINKETGPGAHEMAVKSFIRGDRLGYAHWLEVSAKRGHVKAMHDYGVYLVSTNNREQGRFWLLKAKANGDLDATRVLETLEFSPRRSD